MEFRSLRAGYWIRTFVIVAAGLVCSSSHLMPVKVNRIVLRRHHDPVRIHRQRDATTSETYNWSGYAVTGPKNSVTDVKSSWVVPPVNCSTKSVADTGYAAFWTGIDGWTSTSNTVEQIGTDSDCVNLAGTKTSTPTYYAWFEFYPQYAYLIGNYTNTGKCLSDCVFPGDMISAEVQSGSSGPKPPGPGRGPGGGPGGGQKFTVTISDQTRGWSFTTSSPVPGAQQSSAEWIAEAPSGCNTASGICPLADFSTPADYSASYATVNGKTGQIGSFGKGVQEAIMVDYPSGTTIMAQASALLNNGTSFYINWYSAGP